VNDFDFILGLMRQNTNALGFIPDGSIEHQYVANGRHIIQTERGRPVGYILHGKPTAGGVLTIAQACIEYDKREKGYGIDVVNTLIERAKQTNCRAITLRCAEDLAANAFWKMTGFEHTSTLTVANTRRRKLNVYTLDLWPTLWRAA
jgi:GNAT superfamily N-acetyltransferase